MVHYEQIGDRDEHVAHYSTEIDLGWFRRPFPHDVVRSLMVSGDRDLVVEEIPRLSPETGESPIKAGSEVAQLGLGD
jgi:hypothetical protein